MSEDGKATEPVNRLPPEDLTKVQAGAKDPNKVVLTEEQIARWLSLQRTKNVVAALLGQAQATTKFLSVEEDRIGREETGLKVEMGIGQGNWLLDEKARTCVRTG